MLLPKYRKRYIKKPKEKNKNDEKISVQRRFKIHSLNKVIHHIKQTANKNPDRIFGVKQLENTDSYLLKIMFPDLEIC